MKNIILIHTISLILTFAYKQTNAQWTNDTITFEMPSTLIVIDTSNGNLWQIGEPQKTFFNNAYSGTKAILTDTINDYPPNDTSSFIFIIRKPYTGSCYTCMEFWNKYDMDSLADKGIIEASYDGGNSWLELKDSIAISPMVFSFHWNGDFHPSNGNYTSHKLITQGKSDGWIQSSFCWQWFFTMRTDTIISPPNDSLMVRFTFISDSIIKSKEGWMIDNIIPLPPAAGDCSGIRENSNSEKISVYPNPFSSYTTLHTNKLLKNSTLTVYNSRGQTVKQILNISGHAITLFRDNLSKGLYLFRLTEGNRTFTTEKLLIMDN